MFTKLTSKVSQGLKDYFAITLGLACYAFGWVTFMLPYQITTGGLVGVSSLIYYVTGIEIQVSYFIINTIFLVFNPLLLLIFWHQHLIIFQQYFHIHSEWEPFPSREYLHRNLQYYQ